MQKLLDTKGSFIIALDGGLYKIGERLGTSDIYQQLFETNDFIAAADAWKKY